jgi:GNAT superfamily N-acetyltransferase
MTKPPITLATLDDHAAFRFADPDDVPALLGLYTQFFEEAAYKDFLEFDPARVRATILDGILADTRPHILAVTAGGNDDGFVIGFIAYVFDHTFSVKPCQVLMEFYVVPEFRASAVGRVLLGLAILEGKEADAGAFHAPIASGMMEARTMFNLFNKAGFSQLGYVMRLGY